ncbi:MAG: hypothetical protein K6F01_03555 [Selenomonas sp.]|uniref:hypothetical protein n=1 Tax=Selenomonas sp. TaxID=2053611 RepID=UPI0025DBCB26|nr:hypothetical protein [Selenomonas sp.]MCR5438499.1 hypothetical protein [Selenomonas sp.]
MKKILASMTVAIVITMSVWGRGECSPVSVPLNDTRDMFEIIRSYNRMVGVASSKCEISLSFSKVRNNSSKYVSFNESNRVMGGVEVSSSGDGKVINYGVMIPKQNMNQVMMELVPYAMICSVSDVIGGKDIKIIAAQTKMLVQGKTNKIFAKPEADNRVYLVSCHYMPEEQCYVFMIHAGSVD